MWFNKLLKVSFKENKTFSVILFLLIVISVTLIVGGLSTSIDTKNTFREKFDEYGYGENNIELNYLIMGYGNEKTEVLPNENYEKVTKFLDSNKYVESYRDAELIYLWRYSLTKENDEKEFYADFGVKFIENVDSYKPTVMEGDLNLKDDEIMLSLSAKNSNKVHAEIGDYLVLTYGKESIRLKVVGFFEDIINGNSFVGTKNILTNINTVNKITDMVERNYKEYLYSSASREITLNIKITDSKNGQAFIDEYCKFMKDTFELDLDFTYNDVNYFEEGMFMLSDILCYVLVFLGALLFIITLFVLRYIIKATIEMNYKDIGVKKALGFKHRDISNVLMVKYLIITLLACLTALLTSFIFVITIGKSITLTQLAYYINGSVDFVSFIVCTAIILLLMWLFSYLMLRRLKRVSPITAVSDGKRDFYFAKKVDINLKKTKLPTNLAMSVKAMCSNKGTYIAIFLIIFLLVLFCGFILELSSTMNDTEKSSQIFGLDDFDMVVSYDTEKTNREEVRNVLEAHDNIEIAFMKNNGYCYINDMGVRTEMSSEFDRLKTNNLLKGRNPQNENEIALGRPIMQYLGLEVGDYVDFALIDKDKSKRLIIVGEFQTMMEMGYVVRVAEDILYDESYGENQFATTFLAVILKDKDKFNSTKTDIENLLGDKVVQVERMTSIIGFTEVVGDLFSVVSIITTICSVVFIMLVMYLLTKIIISKEEKSIFSMMAMGFKRSELKLQIVLRFVLITVLSCIIAVPLIILLSNPFMELFGSVIGLAKITTPIDLAIPFILGGFVLINAFIMPIISLVSINNKSIMSKLNNE